jgi:hypothetical protein
MNYNRERNKSVYEVITMVVIFLFLVYLFIKFMYF